MTPIDIVISTTTVSRSIAVSKKTQNQLYQILPTEITKALYRILSTDKAGLFVIVKK